MRRRRSHFDLLCRSASYERLDKHTIDGADRTPYILPGGQHFRENYPTGAGDRVWDVG
jgi:hypothetical protein